MSRASVAWAAALACLLGAPSAFAATDAELRPSVERAYVARVVTPTPARTRPDGGRVRLELATRTRWAQGPVRLLVLGVARDAHGRRQLKVRLPMRPNSSAGWVNADHVRLAPTPWRIVVRRRARTVSVYHSGKPRRSFRAVVGKASTPTPLGNFAV